MKRVITVVLVMGLIAGAMFAPAEAKKKKKKPPAPAKVTREAQGTYAAPGTVVGNCTQTDGVGCMGIPSGAEEQYLTAKVTDESGNPVLISVQADLDGDARSDVTYGVFCGETKEPIQFDAGVTLIFWVSTLTSAPSRVTEGCIPGQGTSGTLDVVFSNML
jgi:hypothetical protein